MFTQAVDPAMAQHLALLAMSSLDAYVDAAVREQVCSSVVVTFMAMFFLFLFQESWASFTCVM